MKQRLDEEQLYEKFRSFAEQNPERKIALLVRTEEEIKAAYRAAVYGELSLLFGNILTQEDAEKEKERAMRAFRELLEENHEFNGFIPKGILVDTPFALLSQISTEGFDFLCYDVEKICVLMAGEKTTAQAYRTAIEAMVRKNFHPKLPRQTVALKHPTEPKVFLCTDL